MANMPDKLLPLPALDSEEDEQEFWATHDSSDFVDWSMAERQNLPDLKRTDRMLPAPSGLERA